MTTTIPSRQVKAPTVSLTEIRRFVQNRKHDPLLLEILETQFDPLPAAAMLRHRMPENSWREDQVDGAAFHADLIEAVENSTEPERAAQHLRPALRILSRFGFKPLPEIQTQDLLIDAPTLGLRGKLDLVGWIHGRPAVVEVKTVHRIPTTYAHLEHCVQAALLFNLAWDRLPRPGRDEVAVLYVESASPHRAFIQSVQLPRRFIHVGSRLAAHLLRRN